MKYPRNAQISMFVIIGLLLLLGVIISITIFSDFLNYTPPEEQIQNQLETELQPLVLTINQCQEQILEEAALEVLRGGGYLEEYEQQFNTVLAPNNNAIQLQRTLPYWRYVDQGAEATQKPRLQGPNPDTISSQLGRYVDQRIQQCVDFTDYTQYSIREGSPRSFVTFSNDETRIDTQWPVTVNASLGVKEYDGFQTAIDAPVQRLYTIAEEIIDATRSTKLIENRVLDWISVYEGINDLPPLSGSTELTRDFEIYTVQEAKQELNLVIARTLSHVQLLNSQDPTLMFREDDNFNIIQINSLIPATSQTTAQTRFRAYKPLGDHPSLETHLLINNNRAIAMPEITQIAGSGLLQAVIPPIVDNRFSYETTFPVVIEISQSDYTMQLAYQANIQDNQPQVPQELGVLDEENSLCENRGGAQLNLQITPSDQEASILYTCGATTCGLGETRNGELQTQLPSCASGEIEAYSPGRLSEPLALTSTAGEVINEEIQLYEPQPIELELRAREVALIPNVDLEAGTVDVETQMASTSTLYDAEIYFLRQGMPYVDTINTAEAQEQVINLIPGNYDVFAVRLSEEEHVIEEETRTEGRVLGGIISQGEEVTLPEVVLEAIPVGYLELQGEQAVPITPSTQQLTLTMPRMRVEDLRDHEDLELINVLMEFGANMPNAYQTN